MAKRAFLNMAGGVLEGDQLIVQCDNDLVKNTLSKDDVVEVLRQTASEFLGRSIAVRVVTKSTSVPLQAEGKLQRRGLAVHRRRSRNSRQMQILWNIY